MPTPQTKRIYQLPRMTNPALDLAGAQTVWEVPLGPVVGGFKTYAGTPEDLADYLAAQGLLGGTSQFLLGTYTIQAADLPAPQITVPNAVAFSPQVGIVGTNGSLVPLAYGVGYTIAGNVLTILAAANPQPGEVVHYSYLPGSVPATSQLIEIGSDNTYRVARIKLLRPLMLQGISLLASANAQGVKLQVSAYRNNSWLALMPHTTLADAVADLATLTPADYAAGAELEIQTEPVAVAAASTVVLSVAGADSLAFLNATRAYLRTNNNAPPGSYTGITAFGLYEENSAYISPSGNWAVSTGTPYSAGACLFVNGANAATDTITIRFWFIDAARLDLIGLTDATLGKITLTLDGQYFDMADQQANPSPAHTYFTSAIMAPGEHTLVVTGAAGRTFLWDAIRFYAA